MVTFVDRRVSVFSSAAGVLRFLLIGILPDLLTTGTGPVLLMSSESAPASQGDLQRFAVELERWDGFSFFFFVPSLGKVEHGQSFNGSKVVGRDT
jgi:hypothetical protein